MSLPLIETLAQARKAAGLTQAQLAERSGLSRMTVQRQEGGQLDPRLSTLHEMARTLGLELIAVPANLKSELQAFIASGGWTLAQPTNVDPPSSVVEPLGRQG